ncbi:hypothetical protein BJV77DRAFT_616793 [Russula vinacea]|nr:hypothetical protein BJV77DRAFT_616793 [Russula vinacea]
MPSYPATWIIYRWHSTCTPSITQSMHQTHLGSHSLRHLSPALSHTNYFLPLSQQRTIMGRSDERARRRFPTSGIESNLGHQIFLPSVFRYTVGIWMPCLTEDMKLHCIASDWCGSCTHRAASHSWHVALAAPQHPMADMHGISVVSSSLHHFGPVFDEHSHSPLTSSRHPRLLPRASPTNRSPSRDATRLQLVAVSECFGTTLTPPNAMRNCAFDSLHYLSSFIAGYLPRFWAPCQIGALTTRLRVSCGGPAFKTTLGVWFSSDHIVSPHKTPTLLP